MRVAVLQHVPFEGLGAIAPWLDARGADVRWTRFHAGDAPPSLDGVTLLIVLGGPMSVNDEREHPWLAGEKRLVAQAIERGVPTLGICLGAQLMASALGARVFANEEREIGWAGVERAAPAPAGHAWLPSRLDAFHWHGETFELPRGALHLARSAGCAHQAFALGERAIGLQFHLETTPGSARALIEHCPGDLAPGRFVQSAQAMLADAARFDVANGVMSALLRQLAGEGA